MSYFHRLHKYALLLLCAMAQAAVPPAPEGEARFYAKHQPWMDKYDGSQSSFDHYDTHFYRMQVYAGYWAGDRDDRYQRGWVYKDSYALKPAWAVTAQHPEWVLRDADGSRLYIPWGCSGGTCPQYAADVGNQNFRDWWIGELRGWLAGNHYAGVWVDDVNMDFRVGNGAGQPVVPIDPRTGQRMSLANWRRYFAEFVEQVRAAFPATEIAHNAIWYAENSRTDPYIRRQVLAADYFNLERGFTDAGITSGTGKYSLIAYLALIDYVHSLGRAVVQMEYTTDASLRGYALAGYLVTNAGRDLISSDHEWWVAPGYWWSGWDTDLGAALGSRYAVPGGWRRDFTCGYAQVQGPPLRTGSVVRTDCWSCTECHA